MRYSLLWLRSNTAKIFAIWPFLAFIFSVFDFGKQSSRITIILFFTLLGFSMVLNRETMDGYKHSQVFEAAKDITLSNFTDEVQNILLFRSVENVDFYLYTTNFLFSRFTSDPRIIFTFHSFIFALLLVSFLGSIYDNVPGIWPTVSILIFLLLVFINPITNVHFIRFPIGSWIFLTGAYHFIVTRKTRFIAFAFLAVIVHFAFTYAVAALLLYAVFGNRHLIYSAVLAFSFIVPDLFYNNVSFMDASLDEGNIEKKIYAYSNEEYIETRKQGLESAAWYRAYRIQIIQYSMYVIMLIATFHALRTKRYDQTQMNLLAFLILLLAFVNFGFSFDSLGRRFFLVWLVLACVYLIRYFTYFSSQSLRNFSLMFLAIPVAFYVIMQLRIGLEVTSVSWFIGNIVVIIAGFIDDTILDLAG
ncbi:MAG TPA: EpsG family protein [Chryseosolibacter sp.]